MMEKGNGEIDWPLLAENKSTVVIHHIDRLWSIDRRTLEIYRTSSCEVATVLPASSWAAINPVVHGCDLRTDLAGDKEKAVSKRNEDKCSCCHRKFLLLSLGALGVVYGDIGTSPLYTIQTIFASVSPERDNVIGGVSSLIWIILLVVTFKYVAIVLLASNDGEGGMMALTALAARSSPAESSLSWWQSLVFTLGVMGTSMFYADSILTPAISVLSALEGIVIATPALVHRTTPIALAILILLFSVQRFGTGAVGKMFGPIILLWFTTLMITGLQHIVQEPSIFLALDPTRAVAFLAAQRQQGGLFAVVGNIVLGVTGSECLYADLGHFGPLAIRSSWLVVAMPALLLNYLGQGALLIRDPTAVDNPFFKLFPDQWLYPAVALSTMATVVASQAVISGTFSITCEAMKLGFLPRLEVHHTSRTKIGQIYLPAANYALGIAVVAVAAGFGKAARLVDAYGLSVTLTMTITTLMVAFVGIRWCVENSKAYLVAPLVVTMAGILAIDVLLLVSCTNKFFDGAYLPFALALVLFTAMTTWARGRRLLQEATRADQPPLVPFLAWLAAEPIPRTPRTAVYAVNDIECVPLALVLNLHHHRAVHQAVVFLRVSFADHATVAEEEHAVATFLAPGCWRVELRYGFKETPDVPAALERLRMQQALPLEVSHASYFISRSLVAARPGSACWQGMWVWRKWLFAAMHHNASTVVGLFGLPPAEVMEVGAEVLI